MIKLNFTNINRWLCLWVIIYFLIGINSAYARIQTQIDRSSIGVNESLNVQFISDQPVDGEPDFSPLQKDFDIVNTSRSNSTNIINGQVTHSYVWSLTLFPKRSGKLSIPAISFGQQRSNPVSIQATKNQTSTTSREPIYIEVNATPKTPYVQAQVLYTVKLFLATEITNASLSEPDIEASKAIFKKLGNDKEYESWRDNQRYRVFERRYVIYPQQSGKLTIDPLIFNARLVQRSRSYFDPFGSSGRLLRIMSDAVSLDIKPIPQQFDGQNWLPASHLTLSETWAEEPPVFKVGEPITRSITLVAAGLTSTQIPELKLDQIEGFKYYPDQPYTEDQPSEDGITGLRQEKIAIIPTKAGQYRLPEISIPWWNTRSKQFQVATIPAREITVLAATQPTASINQTLAAQTSRPQENLLSAQPAEQPQGNILFWQGLSFALAVLWLSTLLLWWKRSKSTHSVKHKPINPRSNPNQASKQLKKACSENNAQKAKDALLAWALCYWPENPPSNLGKIADKTGGALKQQIELLNNQLYSKDKSAWQGHALWMAFQNAQASQAGPHKTPQDNTLEPLHKIQ